ncbi:hypothetical protein ACLB2K_050426 [Fragaria x ananassa]
MKNRLFGSLMILRGLGRLLDLRLMKNQLFGSLMILQGFWESSGLEVDEESAIWKLDDSSRVLGDFWALENVPGFGSLKIADVRDLTFETVEEAEKFYFAYSAAVGFGCRRDDKGESKGRIRWRQWVCSNEGTRDRKYLEADGLGRTPRKQTRVNCAARFRINYNDTIGVYMVKKFDPEHNHELATGNQIAFVRAHRHVSTESLALTNTMTRVSIRPCHTYEYMVE